MHVGLQQLRPGCASVFERLRAALPEAYRAVPEVVDFTLSKQGVVVLLCVALVTAFISGYSERGASPNFVRGGAFVNSELES